jgi:uncharacterized protein YbaR (Trm112 family)
MNKSLLSLLACPLCKGTLYYQPASDQRPERLVCKFDKLAYPIEQEVPMMVPEKATVLSDEELSHVH